jgi:hypothetical protein
MVASPLSIDEIRFVDSSEWAGGFASWKTDNASRVNPKDFFDTVACGSIYPQRSKRAEKFFAS